MKRDPQTATKNTAKPQWKNKLDAPHLKCTYRESMLFLALAALVTVVGLLFMAFKIPGGRELVFAVLTALTGRRIVNTFR